MEGLLGAKAIKFHIGEHEWDFPLELKKKNLNLAEGIQHRHYSRKPRRGLHEGQAN